MTIRLNLKKQLKIKGVIVVVRIVEKKRLSYSFSLFNNACESLKRQRVYPPPRSLYHVILYNKPKVSEDSLTKALQIFST